MFNPPREKKMKRYLGLLLIVVLSLAVTKSYAGTKKRGSSTETFTYQVTSFNHDVGTAFIKVNRKRGKVSKLEGAFKTEGTMQKVFPVDNKQVTYVDRRGNPKKTLQKRSERTIIENFNIKYKRQKVQVFYERGGKESNRVRKHPSPIQDVLTVLYKVSDWTAKEGTSMELTMFSGHQFYKIQAAAVGLEEIWTPARGLEKARRVNVVIKTLSGPRKGEKNKITVWVDSKKSGYLLKAAHHFKLVGDVVVLLKGRSVEKSKKHVIKAKRKARKKKEKRTKLRGKDS
jgi:hypothetical protein